jgi:cyclase
MLKKRVIFTLLYEDGFFMLSRNFRLQKVGDPNWLNKNYNFSNVSYFIDEIVILDVSRKNKNINIFCEALKIFTRDCFVPIAAGGGIDSIDNARKLFRSGADKVVVNSGLFQNVDMLNQIAEDFGEQSIVASLDLKLVENNVYSIYSKNGSLKIEETARDSIRKVLELPVGEIYLNSIDKDGTGQGLDLNMLDLLPPKVSKPIIIAGGVGNPSHILEGLLDGRVDAVATANLFNFIGNSLEQARRFILENHVSLPTWEPYTFENLNSRNQ